VCEWSERLKQQEQNSRQAMEELRNEYQSQLDQAGVRSFNYST